jgi:hypothetical protein
MQMRVWTAERGECLVAAAFVVFLWIIMILGPIEYDGWVWRRRKAVALIVVLLALVGPACSNPPGGAIQKEDAVIVEARPVPLDVAAPERETVGRLRYRGGLALRSADERFGGLSGLLVRPDGGAFTAVSDNGYWISANLIYDADGNLADIAEATIMPMLATDFRRLRSQRESDAESLARAPGGGVIVAFERLHRFWRYGGPGDLPEPVEGPAELGRQPDNQGVEALTTLADGRLLAISEGMKAEGGVAGWLRDEDGRWDSLTWVTRGGFQPTGATTLPDGDVLVLERRFPPVGARIRRLAAGSIAPGAVLDGTEIARLEGSLTVDNMEGIDARLAADGTVLVYVISDDNYSPLQTTLLMVFELLDR